MDAHAVIQGQFSGTHQFVKRTLDGISDDEARRVLNESLAPIVWQVGHLAWADLYLTKAAGASPAATLPAGFDDLFKSGTGGKAAYPPNSTRPSPARARTASGRTPAGCSCS